MLKLFTKLAYWETKPEPREEDRLEIKFVFPGRMLSDARLRVHMHPFGFTRTYSPRQVNNVYFDTPDLDALQTNEAGVARRMKVRVRWYGGIEHMLQPVLELKVKSGLTGRKLQYPLAKDFDLSAERWQTLTRLVRSALPSSMLHYSSFASIPALLNSYQREYYASGEGTIRVTVDHGIRSYDQRFSARANLRQESIGPDLVVVEFKAGMAEEAVLRRATSSFGWRISRNSKYVRGLLPDYLY